MTLLWLIEVQFSESRFVLKIPPIANLQNVSGNATNDIMKQLLLTFLIIFQLDSSAQTDTSKLNFHYKIMEVEGDLNKDSLVDKVVVIQDTLN